MGKMKSNRCSQGGWGPSLMDPHWCWAQPPYPERFLPLLPQVHPLSWFLGTDLPSLPFGELVDSFSAAPWASFSATCAHFVVPSSFLPLLPSFPFPLLFPLLASASLVAVAPTQLRWWAAGLSLRYQRASQGLSRPKWKAEPRLRVMNFPWEAEPGPGQSVGPVGADVGFGT